MLFYNEIHSHTYELIGHEFVRLRRILDNCRRGLDIGSQLKECAAANDDFHTARFIHRHYFMPVFARDCPLVGSIYSAAGDKRRSLHR